MSIERVNYDRILELVVSATKAIPAQRDLVELLDDAHSAQQRGYFLPDEDERMRDRYRQYLRLRAVLLSCIAELEPYCNDEEDWDACLRAFAVAFTAACVLMRAAEFLVDLAGDRFLVWKKLDEAELRYGIEGGSFSRLYKNLTSPRRMWRFYEATLFWELHSDEVMELRAEGGRMRELIEVLDSELPFVGRSKAAYLKRQFQYRVFSFRRRQHTSYRKVMFQMFRMSGKVIAEVKQPILAIQKSGKRVTPRVLAKAWAILQPGDVIVTRHDEAMSNLFLPGFWPHAAFYIGSKEQREKLGILDEVPEGVNVVEAKKDGVHFRALTETLAVDAFTILRSKLSQEKVAAAVRCAISHTGKRYDFVFDFRESDRLACTEVVYRSYQAGAGVAFELEERAGRLCLSAEALMNQGLKLGVFEPVAIYGVDGIKVHEGTEAKRRLAHSYRADW
ncbi:MAG: YiiX/YebB-like N1pC/P60 family cysteine hydrolase [Rubritalea sp.]|uniref:YiiX/YebB-like N1pC/P60 family cysteine hydrolase n=1 Tax=Rubritalea sp. TaxID=2109375 RepID=UPI003242AD31